jgi:hypothetical protein
MRNGDPNALTDSEVLIAHLWHEVDYAAARVLRWMEQDAVYGRP